MLRRISVSVFVVEMLIAIATWQADVPTAAVAAVGYGGSGGFGGGILYNTVTAGSSTPWWSGNRFLMARRSFFQFC